MPAPASDTTNSAREKPKRTAAPTPISYLIAAVLSVFSSSAEALAQGEHVLKAGIMHSESIKSVADQFPVGHTFKEKMIPQSTADIIWYRMPVCFGGTWATDQASFSGRVKPPREPGPLNRHWTFHSEIVNGTVLDRSGRLWQALRLPATNWSESGTIKTLHMVSSAHYEDAPDETATTEHGMTNEVTVHVDKSTNKIRAVEQVEIIHEIAMLDRDHYTDNQSILFFDAHGKPTMRQNGRTMFQKTGGFTPTTDRELLESFENLQTGKN